MTKPPRRILVLGGSSAIAEQACRIWADRRCAIALAGRSIEKLEAVAKDLETRGAAQVAVLPCDLKTAPCDAMLDQATAALGGLDIVLVAYGILGDQSAAEKDPAHAADIFTANFSSAAAWCLAAANRFERAKAGVLLVIGSVAGDRGRQSNYVYGASKAGLGVLVEGIAHRLSRSGARAVLIKPGQTSTPMTAAFDRSGPLWSRPEAVGRIIVDAAESGGPVIYAPGWWRWVMLIIRTVPARILHKTKL